VRSRPPHRPDLANVKIDLDEHDQFVYKVNCVECVARGNLRWSAYRSGGDNGFMETMDRWIFHLNEKHLGVDAPRLRARIRSAHA